MIGAPYRMSEAFELLVRVGCKFDGCDGRSVVPGLVIHAFMGFFLAASV